MTSRNIATRLAKVEESISKAGDDGSYRRYFVQGPVDMDGHEYLRSLGYDLSGNSIVVHFIDAINGRPAYLPPADLTPRLAPENTIISKSP